MFATSPEPRVGIVMGSESDLPAVGKAFAVLDELAVPYAAAIASAHRTPGRVLEFVAEAEGRGVRVFIAAAGGAAHLAGVVAAHTLRPVIGIPLKAWATDGLDALLST
ncbi:MAG TPA: AIR carboxylase family protein, partial [Bacillota bacterium]